MCWKRKPRYVGSEVADMGLDPLRERATARAVIKVHRAIYEWAKGQEAVAPYAAGQIVFADGTKVELVDGLVKIVADGETFTVERFGSYIEGLEGDVGG
jgi:hypothetical protein